MTAKARILFVDDEKRVLNSMRALFRRHYELFLASDGTEAIKIATDNDIDVVVADQRMPGLTGIQVLGQIKEKSPRTVRILLTGYADPSAVEGSINIGEVFRFLSKPCPPKVLRETLSLAIAAAHTKPVPAPQPIPAPKPAATTLPVATLLPEPALTPTPVRIVRQTATPFIGDSEDTQPNLPVLDEATMKLMAEQSSSQWQSVTNVVMTEDTSEETQGNVALTSLAAAKDVGVAVFTVDSDFASTAIRAVSADRNTILATTLMKVAQAIEEHNAGVLVTDFTTNSTVLKKMIGALKHYKPELVTIVVSSGRDTTDMINLINYGQVFRFVLKPVEPEELRRDVNEAIMRHLYLLNSPESAKRHQVISTPDSGDSSDTLNQFIGKFRKMYV